MSTVIIGSTPWEKLIAESLDPAPSRPHGSFTTEEWMRKSGKGRDTSLRMISRLITAGKLRAVEGHVLKGGQLRRAVYYVPCSPAKPNSK